MQVRMTEEDRRALAKLSKAKRQCASEVVRDLINEAAGKL
jgi:FixJ family two-component response regulator